MFITTKRFLYNVLIETVCKKNGCFSVTGARRVGKTILFLQLNEYFGDKSDYFDCTSLTSDTSFDFEGYYQNAIESGKRVIFLDEVCKINDYYLADFIKFTKIYSSSLCIMLTGSVAAIGLADCIISSSDSDNRNDIIVSCMELEYVDLLKQGELYSGLDISKLIKKYGF